MLLDRSQLSYLEYLGPIPQEAAQPDSTKKGPLQTICHYFNRLLITHQPSHVRLNIDLVNQPSHIRLNIDLINVIEDTKNYQWIFGEVVLVETMVPLVKGLKLML